MENSKLNTQSLWPSWITDGVNEHIFKTGPHKDYSDQFSFIPSLDSEVDL